MHTTQMNVTQHKQLPEKIGFPSLTGIFKYKGHPSVHWRELNFILIVLCLIRNQRN